MDSAAADVRSWRCGSSANCDRRRTRISPSAEFGKLPVVANGRLKPMDSLARNSLLQIHEKQTLNTEPWKGWNAEAENHFRHRMAGQRDDESAGGRRLAGFSRGQSRFDRFLKLPGKNPAEHQDGKHYSWNQIEPPLDAFDKENERVEKIDSAERTAYERGVIKVHERMALYAQLKNTVQPQNAQDWKAELAGYENLIPAGVAAVQAQQGREKIRPETFNDFAGELQRFDYMAESEPPLVVPPQNPGGNWQRIGTALLDAAKGDAIPPAVGDYANMADALQNGNAAAFNSAVAKSITRRWSRIFLLLWRRRAPKCSSTRCSRFTMRWSFTSWPGLLAVFSWFNLSETLRRSAVWLVALAFFIHTTGLIYRMVLEGRPPVTNLYSSAIFIGWGAVALGLILEKFHKNGIGVVVSAGIGFITLIIAQNLALEGDTMEMMRAVLDTNFWLATHVVAVTIGYASTFVAGFLALIYILRGVFTRTLDADTGKSLARMVYGIVCFATLFSFVGTVLGGIWADQSWGRFWGWDPKENGALIIVLWNALILHLRWGGMIRERGLVNCAIFGNVVTSWSWFGVNMLGIGLHSYGFTDAAFKWLSLFVVSQLGFIALGLLPRKMWKSPGVPLSSLADDKTNSARSGGRQGQPLRRPQTI